VFVTELFSTNQDQVRIRLELSQSMESVTEISALHSMVVTLASKAYLLCANNTEPVSNFDPIVGIDPIYAIEGIGNCFISRYFFGTFLDRGHHLARSAMEQSNCIG
jgi:hypothetical protein